MTLLHPWLMTTALALGAALVALRLRRGRLTLLNWLVAVSIFLISLAIGEPTVQHRVTGRVAVMVDLSPSTRTATYRDRTTLFSRVKQLVGSENYRVVAFSDAARPLPDQDDLADITTDRTTFTPPADADAVVVFTDGQFTIPTSGVPTYPVIDRTLDQASDASVQRLTPRDNARTLAATFFNRTPDTRRASITNVRPPADVLVMPGSLVVTRDLSPAPGLVIAALSPGDAWPENDAIDIYIPAPTATQRWWVGTVGPSALRGFRVLAPDQLSTDPLNWLSASFVVFDNVDVDALPGSIARALQQFVTQFGGSVLLVNSTNTPPWTGSVFDALSPLSFTAPTSATHWMILVDASGSMAESAGATSRWANATRAVADLLKTLPPSDALSVGSFNRDLNWWATGKSVRQTLDAKLTFPPAGVLPSGPTNLEAVLNQLATSQSGALPTQLIVISDAQANFADLNAIATDLTNRKIQVNLLAIGQQMGTHLFSRPISKASNVTDFSGEKPAAEEMGTHLFFAPLAELVARTGGKVLRPNAVADWAADLRRLTRLARPQAIETSEIFVRWVDVLRSDLPARNVVGWRKSWTKEGATPLAEGSSKSAAEFPAARWQVGAGNVTTFAFSPTPAEVSALAQLTSAVARDPRLRVTWDTGPELRVVIDASDSAGFVNGLALSFDIVEIDATSSEANVINSANRPRESSQRSPQTESTVVPQTAPGRYELALPAPRRPAVATLRLNGSSVVDRAPVAGRYAAEFDHIGTDHDAIKALAERTGGEVIEAGRTTPIDFKWPVRTVSLAPFLAGLAALVMGVALVAWRLKN